MPAALGDLIKRRRAELGMTQARLAELVGKSASAVRSWERGRAAPKGEATRAALAAVLGVTDDELDAAIAGADISFFSDPGRQIAEDPTPTIVQPATESLVADSDLVSLPGAPASEVPTEASEEEDLVELRSEPDLDAEPVSESVLEPGGEARPDATFEPESMAAPSVEPAEISESETESEEEPEPGSESQAELELVSESDVESELVSEPAQEAESEPTEVSQPDAESEPIRESDAESDPGAESEPDSNVSESDSRELVGVGAGTGPRTFEGAATRLVERRQRMSRPAAILAPAPSVEPDPVSQDAWLYRRRFILLGAAVIALLVVLRWALGGVGEAISEVFDNLRTGL